jgi:hypothetical protein
MCTYYLKCNLLCELIPRANKIKKEMKLFLTTLLITIIYAIGCFEVERDALLTFKAGTVKIVATGVVSHAMI